MTDAVTYADLKFEDIVMKENDNREDEDNGSDHGDIMYENVDTVTPHRFRDLPDPSDNPDNKREHRLRLRSEKCLLFHCLLFGILLISTTVGMSVKYVSESRELKRLSQRFVEMNESLSQRLQSKEDLLTSTKNDLESTQKNLERLVRGMNTMNDSLLQCTGDRETLQVQKEKNIQDQQTVERSLDEIKLRVTQMEQDLCSENWIMIGKKCLLINEGTKDWYESERGCLQESANLLTVRHEDEALKSFFSNKGDYWLGKEIRWSQWSTWKEWIFPLGKTESWKCWKISNGELVKDSCQNRNKWICERDILLGKYISKSSDNPLGFRLKETEYQCTKKL
ncbi:B-cell differentiation antigen CD72-like [Rana temporaria]|uniref:B-cell differentiation antigen CD72-like n=1 Tax=Rana temporaria TaxID=8407 RepID=UPI001AACDA04|nr:B-cell differentiation antigen CD72-like [Rana temporaria]